MQPRGDESDEKRRNRYSNVPISRTASARTQANRHCHSTTQAAHPPPISRRIDQAEYEQGGCLHAGEHAGYAFR